MHKLCYIIYKIYFSFPAMQKISTQPEHITNMMTGHINTNVPDRSPKWKNFKDNRFNRPFMVNKGK